MEIYFATIFEDVIHERSLILLLSLVEPNTLKQANITEHEIDIIENIAQRNYIDNAILKK